MRRLKELLKRFKRVWPYKDPIEILPHPESAWPHTSLNTRDSIPHPAYSLDIAPSDFHLCGVPKDAIHGTKLQTDDMIRAVGTSLRVEGKA